MINKYNDEKLVFLACRRDEDLFIRENRKLKKKANLKMQKKCLMMEFQLKR